MPPWSASPTGKSPEEAKSYIGRDENNMMKMIRENKCNAVSGSCGHLEKELSDGVDIQLWLYDAEKWISYVNAKMDRDRQT